MKNCIIKFVVCRGVSGTGNQRIEKVLASERDVESKARIDDGSWGSVIDVGFFLGDCDFLG